MQLKDVMTRDVAVIHPDATLAEASASMGTRNAGSMPVCDSDRLLGVIADRDTNMQAFAPAERERERC
jgi:CBS domain-containing protein